MPAWDVVPREEEEESVHNGGFLKKLSIPVPVKEKNSVFRAYRVSAVHPLT